MDISTLATWLKESRTSKGWLVTMVSLTIFTNTFLYGVVVPIIPSALERCGITNGDKIQFWSSVFLSTYGGATMVGSSVSGWLIGHPGFIHPFIWSLFALAASMLAIGFATDVVLLLSGRLLQGASVSIVRSSALSVLAERLERNDISKAMGWVTLSTNLATVFGPSIGGLLHSAAGEAGVTSATLIMLSSVSTLYLLMRAAEEVVDIEHGITHPEAEGDLNAVSAPIEQMVDKLAHPDTPDTQDGSPVISPRGENAAGPSLFIGINTVVLHADEEQAVDEHTGLLPKEVGENAGDTRNVSYTLLPAALSNVAPVVTFHNEPAALANNTPPLVTIKMPPLLLKIAPALSVIPNVLSEVPLILARVPLLIILLKTPRVLTALFGIFVQCVILASFDAVLPLFVEQTFGWDTKGAGLIFLPLSVPALSQPLVKFLAQEDRWGTRGLVAMGFILTAPALAVMRIITEYRFMHVIFLILLLGFVGITISLVGPSLLSDLTFIVKELEKDNPGAFGTLGAHGQIYSLYVMTHAAGILMGPSWAGTLIVERGWPTLVGTLAGLSLASVVPVLLFTGRDGISQVVKMNENGEIASGQPVEESRV